MSGTFVDAQRAGLIASSSVLYRQAQLIQSGTAVSDGRGGFTASTTTSDIQVQMESLSEVLAARNINPAEALIFILNDGSVTPVEGNAILLDGATYMINRLTLDPVGVAYECVCGGD
jgi:hypothetical protein